MVEILVLKSHEHGNLPAGEKVHNFYKDDFEMVYFKNSLPSIKNLEI
jgi:hypothetical protein